MKNLFLAILVICVFFGFSIVSAEQPAKAVVPAVAAGPAATANPSEGGKQYNFGDMTSSTLASKAWDALRSKDYEGVNVYANKCSELYKAKAMVMQSSLTDFPAASHEVEYWALNDVGTCYYVKGMAAKEQGKLEEAKEAFNAVINDFSYSLCWDPQGWFWKPAQGAKDQMKLMELKQGGGKEYDFGDYTSATLTTNAWGCLDKKDYAGVEIYTKKCIDMYEPEAMKQQGNLTDFLPKEQAFNAWALNDVGTCYFILGEAMLSDGKYKEAKEAYSKIVDKLGFAQCWDPRGWFWKPAVAARGKINKIIAEHGV